MALKELRVVGALKRGGGGLYNGDGVFHSFSFVGGLRREESQNRESVGLFLELKITSFRVMYINFFFFFFNRGMQILSEWWVMH